MKSQVMKYKQTASLLFTWAYTRKSLT